MKHAIQAGTLKTVLDTQTAIVDEAKVFTSEDGWTSRAVDAGNVAMFDINLPSAAFEQYKGEAGTLGIPLHRLDDVIGFADDDDVVHLSIDEETRKLDIQMPDASYQLALIDPDSIRQEPDVPELDLPANFLINERRLDQGVEMANMVADHVRLVVDHNKRTFYMMAEGDTDEIEFETPEGDDEDAIQIDDLKESAESWYSLDYMEDLVGGIPKEHEVRIHLGNEFPIKMFFSLAEGVGSVEYMLAPRIKGS